MFNEMQLKATLDFIICEVNFMHSKHFSASNPLQERSLKVSVEPQESLISPTVKHEVTLLKKKKTTEQNTMPRMNLWTRRTTSKIVLFSHLA